MPQHPLDDERTYAELRRKLVQFLRWRGCTEPEEFVDETMLGLWQKKGQGIEDLDKLAYTIAKRKWIDWLRKQAQQPSPPTPPCQDDSLQLSVRCLHKCLKALAPNELDLFEGYYLYKQLRKEQAQELGMSVNALRQRVFKIKHPLRKCIESCEQQMN